MTQTYDVVVIGGGPGGYTCAAQLAKYGKHTALVEADALGGTCLNRGCIPTKTLLHSADLYHEIQNAAFFGVRSSGASVDYPALRTRKDDVVTSLREQVAKMLKSTGVTVYSGTGYVPQSGIVEVTDKDGNVTTLETTDIVAAVGSCPVRLPIPGMELEGVMTSDDILGKVPELEDLIVIGGGVIGMEFASLYSLLGTKVTVLEGMSRILPPMDKEISQSLAMQLKQRGVTIVTGAMVERIDKDGDRLCCTYTVKDTRQSVSAGRILVSVGRRCDLTALFAESVGIVLNRGRAVVDQNMESNIPHIYVIGDCADGYTQLAHAASAQAMTCAGAITGNPSKTDLTLVPACVYTQPEIASVGYSEAEAKEAGLTAVSGKCTTLGNAKSVITNAGRGFIKIVADENGVIVGAQMMCPRATDMIGEFATAIAAHLTLEQLNTVIHPHPTFEESVAEAVRACKEKWEKRNPR